MAIVPGTGVFRINFPTTSAQMCTIIAATANPAIQLMALSILLNIAPSPPFGPPLGAGETAPGGD